MWNSVERLFAAGHPSAEGHFPGNPIIPGAVLLAETIEAIETAAGSPGAGQEVRAARFHHPIRPGDRILIRWEAGKDGDIKFECRRTADRRIALTGILRLDGKQR